MHLMTKTKENGTINAQRDDKGIWVGIYRGYNLVSVDEVDGKIVITIDDHGCKMHNAEIVHGKVG